MNLASWIILGVVAIVVALAARAAFSTAKKGGCCGSEEPGQGAGADQRPSCSCGDPAAPMRGCGGCSGCKGCSGAHGLQPIIRPLG